VCIIEILKPLQFIKYHLNLTQKYLQNFSIAKKQKLIVSILIILLWIWSFPDTLVGVQGGMEPSWVLGIHMAKIQNFVWGTDIIWTYGPLGYLLFPINIDNELWTQSVSYWIILHSLFFLLLNFFILKTKFPLRNTFIFGFFLIIFLNYTPIYLPLIGTLLGFFLYLQYYKKNYLLISLSFSTAFLMYTKFDLGVGVLSILLLSCIYLLIKKRWKESVFLLGVYFVFLVFIWIILENPLDLFQNYFSSSLEIASGYSTALTIDVVPGAFILFAISAGLLILFWTIKYYKNDESNLKFLFISPVIVFFFFKIGFVRSDPPHILYSFLLFSGFFLILTFLDKNGTNKLLRYSTYTFVILLILTGIMVLNAGQIYKETQSLNISKSLQSSINMLTIFYLNSHLPNFIQEVDFFNDENYSPLREKQKQKIKEIFPISQNTINLLKNQTVDIIPWDVAIPYAYELNYHPRPIFQSHSTYTPNLDNTNAKFFEKETSPQFVLYEKKSIDGRFPTFEAPATLRSLICNYDSLVYEKPFLILEKSDRYSCGEEIVVSNQEAGFNQLISVPSPTQGYMFAKINVKQNLLGKLSSYLYKPPQVFIEINEQSTYRFIYPTAINGILLSSSQELKNDCSLIFEDITSFRIIAEYQNIDPSQQFSGSKFFILSPEQYFDDIIEIEFMEVNMDIISIPTC